MSIPQRRYTRRGGSMITRCTGVDLGRWVANPKMAYGYINLADELKWRLSCI